LRLVPLSREYVGKHLSFSGIASQLNLSWQFDLILQWSWFEDLLEGKIMKSVIENFREGSRNELVDQIPRYHKAWLPGAVDYLVKNILKIFLAEQEISDMQL